MKPRSAHQSFSSVSFAVFATWKPYQKLRPSQEKSLLKSFIFSVVFKNHGGFQSGISFSGHITWPSS